MSREELLALLAGGVLGVEFAHLLTDVGHRTHHDHALALILVPIPVAAHEHHQDLCPLQSGGTELLHRGAGVVEEAVEVVVGFSHCSCVLPKWCGG